MYLYRAVDSEGHTLEFLFSPTRHAEVAKRFFEKALHSRIGSAPGADWLQEQVEESMTLADPNILTSAPGEITVQTNAASPVGEPTHATTTL